MNDDALTEQIATNFKKIINEPNMHKAKQCLLKVIKDHGIGVALLVLHQRALTTGYIPKSNPVEPVEFLPNPADKHNPADKFVYVHAPVRAIRSNREELVKRGIMNDSPDRNRLVYHEDGLVGTFSFKLSDIKDLYLALPPQDVVSDLLTFLEAQDILEQVELNSWQVQFKDIKAKERILESVSTYPSQRVFVRTDKKFDPEEIWLPDAYDRTEIRSILKTALAYKAPCNYCGVRELNPLEDIISTNLVPDWEERYHFPMSRSYEFGFTFAPFGEPNAVCHFLAWDSPSIGEVVNNMDLQTYSFGDLVRLTCAINQDIKRYCDDAKLSFTPFVGVCNHWAGNSIYHQHYQFFRIPDLPLFGAGVLGQDLYVNRQTGLKLQRLSWPMPVYRIVMNDPVQVEALADLTNEVAIFWNSLSKPEERIPIGNEITINNNTQNTIITQKNGATEAYFIPRLRSKLNAVPRHGVNKTNLAVLEAAGYLLIDGGEDWAVFNNLTSEQRNEFGEGALKDVSPNQSLDDARVTDFQDELLARIFIGDIGLTPLVGEKDIEREIRQLLSKVQEALTDPRMSPKAKELVLKDLNTKYQEMTAQRNRLVRRPDKEGDTLFTDETIKKLLDSHALTIFAGRFVEPRLRERFVHEALKEPQALHRRVCHRISELFAEKYCGCSAPFNDSDECLFLGWSAPWERMDWQTAKSRMSAGGGGYLVIKADGSAFYAETEGYPPICYAGA